MHELSIALRLLDLAAQAAQAQGTGRVLAVHVKVGAWSGVVPEALRSAFEVARVGSPLAEARLEIEHVPLELCCPDCGLRRQVEDLTGLPCPDCGQARCEVVGGRELELTALELVP
jgi:hydrogenase nickel incorporation protein HypA/HybF